MYVSIHFYCTHSINVHIVYVTHMRLPLQSLSVAHVTITALSLGLPSPRSSGGPLLSWEGFSAIWCPGPPPSVSRGRAPLKEQKRTPVSPGRGPPQRTERGGRADGRTGGQGRLAGDPRTCSLSAGLPALLESSAPGVSFSGNRVSFLTYKNLSSITCACSSE